MKCPNCQKEIDDDSKFCIFCGADIEKEFRKEQAEIEDKLLANQDDKPEDKAAPETKVVEKKDNIYTNNYSDENNREPSRKLIGYKVALSLVSLLVLILIIIVSANLSVNKKNLKIVRNYMDSIDSLSEKNRDLKLEKNSLSRELDEVNTKYKSLLITYNRLNDRYNNKSNSGESTTNSSDSSSNYNPNSSFLNNVYNLLDEYNLAANHMNTYHQEGWIFNNPSDIALEETLLTKLQELSNKLKGFSYPNSFSSQRNKLVGISEEICHYQSLSIQYMKNNDFNNYINNFNARNDCVDNLFNYCNSLVR